MSERYSDRDDQGYKNFDSWTTNFQFFLCEESEIKMEALIEDETLKSNNCDTIANNIIINMQKIEIEIKEIDNVQLYMDRTNESHAYGDKNKFAIKWMLHKYDKEYKTMRSPNWNSRSDHDKWMRNKKANNTTPIKVKALILAIERM